LTGSDREIAWQGRYLSVVLQGRWEYAERVGHVPAVVIVALDDDALILVEQYRVPAGRRCLELPAGLVGDDGEEDQETAARRELEEETGYRAGRIELLGDFYSSPGLTSERFTVVRATELTRIGPGGGTGGEDITVHRVPLAEVPNLVARSRRAGLGIDAKLLLALSAL
jgi:ADP-ribose pyrophosphatase